MLTWVTLQMPLSRRLRRRRALFERLRVWSPQATKPATAQKEQRSTEGACEA